ncbi:MAG: tetratricopeptide repeat protein [Treponema sp.]|jgi:tetratricopeptide (TPR) repeat protein|nr:tetratricopeptide repeat protein [Treponema sp.]
MPNDPLLQRALALARKGKYESAVKTLEGEVFRYQESHPYYYLLGTSCLYAGDFGGAFTYFNRARTIKMRNPETLLGMALLFLRRGDTDRALDLYLDVQDIDPKNAIVKRALKLLHRYSGGEEDFSAWLEHTRLDNLYPPLPSLPFRVRIKAVHLIIIFAAASALGIVIGVRSVPKAARPGMESSVMEAAELEFPLDMQGSFRYVLTRGQVIDEYREARDYFNDYHDEKARRILNRLLESNASAAVKNKARLLESYLETPGFDNLKDFFTFSEVSGDPVLYRNCFVLWRGTAANVQNQASKTVFDLLVGYDTRKIMEGAVTIEIDFPDGPIEINTAVPIEVLGSVVPLNGGTFMIRAAGIHQSPAA